MSKIAEAIKKAAMVGEQLYLKTCTVVSVDEDSATCVLDPIDGGAQMEDVALCAEHPGIVVLPEVGSLVVAGYLDKYSAVVVSFGNVEGIRIDAASDIVLNGGDNAGMVRIHDLTQKLNNLTKQINALVGAYNAHVHTTTATVGDGPVGVISPTTTQASQVDAFQASDYENDKIKH